MRQASFLQNTAKREPMKMCVYAILLCFFNTQWPSYLILRDYAYKNILKLFIKAFL